MKNYHRAAALLLFAFLLCGKSRGVCAMDDSDMFSSRDMESDFTEEDVIRIELQGDSVSCSSDRVQIDGTTVSITDEGTYLLSGTLDDGRIIVDAEDTDKPRLILNGASVNCASSAALSISQADKVFLTLAPDTENLLSNGGSFADAADEKIDGTIFSRQDLTFNGSGRLTVDSPAGHGIVCKDDLVFAGGTYAIDAASHAIDANDSIRFTGSSFEISSEKDGIHAENEEDTTLGFIYIADGTFAVTSGCDGISASSDLQIENGSFHITAGGGSANAAKERKTFQRGFMDRETESTADLPSTKALKASGNVLVNSGTFVLDSADDALHANGSITINGGTCKISSGDDGVHADETLTITDGQIQITESYEGLEALTIRISGGEFDLTAQDDGINAAGGTDSSGFGGPWGGEHFGGRRGKMDSSSSSGGSIDISGGKIYVQASGDGLDANGTLEISGGYVIVCGPSQGDTATLDYDVSGVITGGTFIGTGGSMMAQTFSSSEQGVLAVNAGNQPAGTQITLTDASGSTLFSQSPELPFSVVILSSPDLIPQETYTLTVGDLSEEFSAD